MGVPAYSEILGVSPRIPFQAVAFNAELARHGVDQFDPPAPAPQTCLVAEAMAHVESRVRSRTTFDLVQLLFSEKFGSINPAAKSPGIPQGSLRTAAGDIYSRVVEQYCFMTRDEFAAGVDPAQINLELGSYRSWYIEGSNTPRTKVILGRSDTSGFQPVIGIDGTPALVSMGVLGFYAKDDGGPHVSSLLGLGCVRDDRAPPVEGKAFFRKSALDFAAPSGAEAVYVAVRPSQVATIETHLRSCNPLSD